MKTNHEKPRDKYCLAYCVSQRSRRKRGGGRGEMNPKCPIFSPTFYLPNPSPFTPARQATIVWAATQQETIKTRLEINVRKRNLKHAKATGQSLTQMPLFSLFAVNIKSESFQNVLQ